MERGEGDALSRLSVDSSIVGERLTVSTIVQESADDVQSITQNLSDGLRAVVMSFAGRKHPSLRFRELYVD